MSIETWEQLSMDEDWSFYPRQYLELSKGANKGWVYVFWIGHGDIFKIGHTGDPLKRMHNISSIAPFAEITLVEEVYNPEHIEGIIHSKFSDKRLKRELFRLSRKNLLDIKEFLNMHRQLAGVVEGISYLDELLADT